MGVVSSASAPKVVVVLGSSGTSTVSDVVVVPAAEVTDPTELFCTILGSSGTSTVSDVAAVGNCSTSVLVSSNSSGVLKASISTLPLSSVT